jgi:hypothetical protein
VVVSSVNFRFSKCTNAVRLNIEKEHFHGKRRKTMNTRETTELENFIFDLSVADEEQDEVKGGFGEPVTFTATVSSVSPATPKLFLHCATGQH